MTHFMFLLRKFISQSENTRYLKSIDSKFLTYTTISGLLKNDNKI